MSAVAKLAYWQTPSPGLNPLGENREYLRQILVAQLNGATALPYGLGLEATAYQLLLVLLDDHEVLRLDREWRSGANSLLQSRAQLRFELLQMRSDERDDIVRLLGLYSDPVQSGHALMAIVIATACLGAKHLWQDLGLVDRAQLRSLLTFNFPSLVALNTRDMRWKRFFYRMLCESDGDYLCRAPSCEECSSHAECFSTT